MNIGDVIILLALIVVGYFQIYQIKALKTAEQSQRGIIDSMKKYIDIFDVDEFRKFTSMKEETIRAEYEENIKSLKAEYNKKITNLTEIQSESYQELIGYLVGVMMRVPHREREYQLKNVSDPLTKRVLTGLLDTMKDHYYPITLLDMLKGTEEDTENE